MDIVPHAETTSKGNRFHGAAARNRVRRTPGFRYDPLLRTGGCPLNLAQGAVRELRLEQEGNQAMIRQVAAKGI